jgi:hypothetical protein
MIAFGHKDDSNSSNQNIRLQKIPSQAISYCQTIEDRPFPAYYFLHKQYKT